MEEIIIDTNIFVRHITDDVKSQSKEATRIFKQIEQGLFKGIVSLLVINELIWILDKFYKISRKTYIPGLLKILALRNLEILETDKSELMEILDQIQSRKIDFTDFYLFSIAGSRRIISFDKDFLKLNK